MSVVWRVLKAGGIKGTIAKFAILAVAAVAQRNAHKLAVASKPSRSRKQGSGQDNLEWLQSASERAKEWLHDNDVPTQFHEFVRHVVGETKLVETKLKTTEKSSPSD